MTKEEKIATQRKLMTDFMNYFKDNELDFNNTQLLQEMQETITKIFQLEIEELGYSYNPDKPDSENTIHLKFVNDKNIMKRGRLEYKTGKPSIIMYNIAHLYEDLESEDKDKRLLGCKELFRTVFHEIQHFRQHLMVEQKVSSKDVIRFARDFVLKSYLEKDWYSKDIRKGNYDAYITENNANETGYKQYLEIMDYDEEISNLFDIEGGKFNMGRYKANVNSCDNGKFYDSKGLKERDEITIPILDDLICRSGLTTILKKYPILQKEYNLDGTKKSASELIKNMEKEVQAISNNNYLSQEERRNLIKDAQEMYYELIYNQIERSTQKQISELATQIGKDKVKDLFDKISYYFNCELKNRLEKSARMAAAKEKSEKYLGFILSWNMGEITVLENGKELQVNVDEFIRTLNSSLMQREFIIPSGKNKGVMSAEQFIKEYLFRHLSSSGKVTLKDNTEISAKQYIEQYILTIKDLPSAPIEIIKDTMKSENFWDIHRRDCQRLEAYYENRKQVLANIEQEVVKINDEYREKINWIKEFVDDYDANELSASYALRANCEEENIKRIIDSIKTQKLVEKLDNDLNVSDWKKDPEQFSWHLVPAMVRLLKVAESLSYRDNRNYLKEFISIPEIDKILLMIRDSKPAKEMHKGALKNRKTGNLPKNQQTNLERYNLGHNKEELFLNSLSQIAQNIDIEQEYEEQVTTSHKR